MRAPTVPEAHLGAVILASALAWSWYGFAAWQHPLAAVAGPLLFVPFGVWLRWAWQSLQLQRRVVGAYTERLRQAGAIATKTGQDLTRDLAAAAETRRAKQEEQKP